MKKISKEEAKKIIDKAEFILEDNTPHGKTLIIKLDS
jgi:hypothetical protein